MVIWAHRQKIRSQEHRLALLIGTGQAEAAVREYKGLHHNLFAMEDTDSRTLDRAKEVMEAEAKKALVVTPVEMIDVLGMRRKETQGIKSVVYGPSRGRRAP